MTYQDPEVIKEGLMMKMFITSIPYIFFGSIFIFFIWWIFIVPPAPIKQYQVLCFNQAKTETYRGPKARYDEISYADQAYKTKTQVHVIAPGETCEVYYVTPEKVVDK